MKSFKNFTDLLGRRIVIRDEHSILVIDGSKITISSFPTIEKRNKEISRLQLYKSRKKQ